MHVRQQLSPGLRELARVQCGVLGRGQLLQGGLSRMVIRRMLAGEFLEVLTPGVYVRGGSVSWLGRAWAGLLLGGPPAVLGLEAAAHLHGLLRKAPDEVVVFTPRRVLDRPGWRFVRSERAGSGEPVRTPLDATVIDLCAERDEDGVAALLADAARRLGSSVSS